jgi:hypothetical protein
MRNKVIAHSDREMMRITAQTFSMPLRDEKEIVFVQTVFDEGITLLGDLPKRRGRPAPAGPAAAPADAATSTSCRSRPWLPILNG